jgi:hypothetical protein
MGEEKRSYLTRLAPIVVLAVLTSCHKQVTPPPPAAQPSYGAKIRYAGGQKIEYPDFTIEFIGEKPPRHYEKYPRREFRITGGGEVQEVSWGRDYGDIGRVKFKVGGDRYMMELVGSIEHGFLGEDVMVVWKNPP